MVGWGVNNFHRAEATQQSRRVLVGMEEQREENGLDAGQLNLNTTALQHSLCDKTPATTRFHP